MDTVVEQTNLSGIFHPLSSKRLISMVQRNSGPPFSFFRSHEIHVLTVTQGMELFTIENTDKASVDVTLSKYDYNTVKEGQSVEITLGDNTYQGTVTKMSHIAVQNEKGTPVISATVSIDNPDEDIFLGVDAKVKIYAASAKNVVTLPVEVVNIGKEGSFCYVIEDGLVTKRNITTGISSEDYVEITDGIKEGEEVIADLGDYTEGMEVQAVPEQTGEDADE